MRKYPSVAIVLAACWLSYERCCAAPQAALEVLADLIGVTAQREQLLAAATV